MLVTLAQMIPDKTQKMIEMKIYLVVGLWVDKEQYVECGCVAA